MAVSKYAASGMVLGLGSGSTATFAVQAIGRRLKAGELRDLVCVPSSEKTAREARKWDIPLTTLDEHPRIDVTIDGTDEVTPDLDLIKGLGGSLLREKIVAASTEKLIIIADYRKRVQRLGERAPLPVEVIPFALNPVERYLRGLGSNPVLRVRDGKTFVTDEGNVLLDCHFEQIDDPVALGQAVRSRPGVVEHGFFLGMAYAVLIATPDGVEEDARRQ